MFYCVFHGDSWLPLVSHTCCQKDFANRSTVALSRMSHCLANFKLHFIYNSIALTHQSPLDCPQTVCTAGPVRLADKRLNLWLMKKGELYKAEPEARCQSLRAELVSATYFVHRRGYHDTKYYKTSCSCTKTNTFVEILHFKQQLIQTENSV